MTRQERIWDSLYKRNLTWKKETISLPKILKNKEVLEVGVGTGKTLLSIIRQNPKSVTAIDFSEEVISSAKKALASKWEVNFLKADITSITPNKKFDVVVCYYILNNLTNSERKKAVSNVFSFLKPGGIVLFEDFAVGDFREKKEYRIKEPHTIKKLNGLTCHFFSDTELKKLFGKFSQVTLSEKTTRPLKSNPKVERKILSAIVKK